MPLSAELNGLQPNATYHWRLVAANAAGTTSGPDRTLETGPGLPDGRAYEMVSPPDKNGNGILIDSQRTRAAVEGDAVAYGSLIGFGDVLGTGVSVDYMAVRHADRWETHAITPRQDPQASFTITFGKDPIYEGEMSPDLSKGVARVNPSVPPLTPGAPNVAKTQNLYLRTDLRTPGAGAYALLTDAATPMPSIDNYAPGYAAASADFRHVAFDSVLNLTPDAAGASRKAYEWVDGTVRLAGILPDGTPAPSSVIDKGSGYARSHAVSPDGSRVLFTVPDAESGALYMRVGGTTTVQLNRSERTVPDTPQPAKFEVESADDSRVFFTTIEQLVDGDTDNCADLYMYDASLPASDPHNLTRISVDHEPGDAMCADVRGAVGASADGDTVYFTATRQLVAGAPLRPGLSGDLLFVWRDGQLRYIGGLARPSSLEDLASSGVGLTNIAARVTPDGSHALLAAFAGTYMTGYDHGRCGVVTCRELYVYDADANGGSGELACVSCRPDGAPATSDAAVRARAGTGGANSSTHLGRPLSEDGRWVFFDTGDRLLPQDRNDVRDVYEYDTQTGQLALITSGAPDARDAYMLDASASGRDVFFASADRLSPWDTDAAYDVYDARVGGGLPDPPSLVPPCTGSACQGEAPAAPAAPQLGTLTFTEPSSGGVNLSGGLLPLFRTLPMPARQLRRWALRGRALLRVQVSEAGRIGVRVRARIGRHVRLVASARRTAHGGTTLRLPLRLSRAARRHLLRTGRLRLSILVGYSQTLGRERASVTLRRTHHGVRAARGGRS